MTLLPNEVHLVEADWNFFHFKFGFFGMDWFSNEDKWIGKMATKFIMCLHLTHL